ncbi:hypothetical protein AK88_02624 [Plasmodium fragile]|uniref:Uncharacterized protein n=1 Tax=Plasmodium fragile TaxID=5857 RepID=A0A0D9QL35_PLAFR|nr:uncharacterized protein AK88_02624 [Plasmodium fragile]KJP87729.1 hypothetical protein AK88_02624 [Plasmodium fragile]
MYRGVNVDSRNNELITKKDSLSNLNAKERSSGRIAKSYYDKHDTEHMMQNAGKNYLDHFDAQNGNLNKNYIYSCDNLMDEDSRKTSNLHSKMLEEHLNNYSYHVDPDYIRNNKYASSQERAEGNHLISLSEHRNMILSNEFIKNSYLTKNYEKNKNDGNKNKDEIVHTVSNHYNNLIKTTNKGIENINSNCDAIISKQNYDSLSDVSSIILINQNDNTQNNNDYADYNYNSYFNYRNDHTSAHHYNGNANSDAQHNAGRTGQYNGCSTGNNKRHSNGRNNRSQRNKNGNYDGEKRESFPFAHESSLNENLIHDSCDYDKIGKDEMEIGDNQLNSLSVYNDEDAQNRILQEMDEQAKQDDMHFTSRLQNNESENTNNRIKIYDIFNNLNIKKSNNTNTGILNFLKNQRMNKYTYDSKGIRNEAAENKAIGKELHNSGVTSKAGGIPVDGHAGNGHKARSANTSSHSNTERSHSNYRFNGNMRNIESKDTCNNPAMFKGCAYTDEEAKNRVATPHRILIDQKYIEESEHRPSKMELANKSNISSFETLKHLERDNNGHVTNLYGTAVNEFLNKKDSCSDECSNKTDAERKQQNNPFSVYHYVKRQQAANGTPLPNGKGKGGSNKSSSNNSGSNKKIGSSKMGSNKSASNGSKGNKKCNVNGGSSKSNRSRKTVESNYNPIYRQYVHNHDCGNELPHQGDNDKKKSPISRDTASHRSDNYSIGKKGVQNIYKNGSEVHSGNFKHYSRKSTKKDSLDRERNMDVKRTKQDKDHQYFKKGIETDREFPFNAQMNGNNTYFIHDDNRKNEKIKTNEELSSIYISSYSDSSMHSPMQSFVEPKNRGHQNSCNSKITLTKGIKNKSPKKYNEKRKMDMKEKQENEQFHRCRSNSIVDDVCSIYGDAKQYNFIDGIDENCMHRKDTCRHIFNDHSNFNNANKNSKGVGTDARIFGHSHNYDQAKTSLQQNNCKHECRNAHTEYVKKKKKKKNKKNYEIDRYTESGSIRDGASIRDEDGCNNDYKNSLKGEDSYVRHTHIRSNSPNVKHSYPSNGVEVASKKYPSQHDNALKGLSADKGNKRYGDSDRVNGCDDAYDHLFSNELSHSMNPFRYNMSSNPREVHKGSNEVDGYNNNSNGCDRHGKCNGRVRDKNGNVNNLEKSQIALECNKKCVLKKNEKKKKTEEPFNIKQTIAQDEDIAHGDDIKVFVKCKMKKKSCCIISDYEERVCSMRENVAVSKTHFVADCKKMHQGTENTSKKCTLKKGANQSSSSFNTSSNKNYEKDEDGYDNNAVRRKSTRLKENNMKNTHITPQHSNAASIRSNRDTNTCNIYNSQSRSSNLHSGMSNISSSSDDMDDGENQNVKWKTGKNQNSHFPNRGKNELNFCCDQEENQRCRRERDTFCSVTEIRDSNSDAEADSDVGKQNREVSRVERDSHFTSSRAPPKKSQSNLAKCKKDKRQDLSTGEDNTDSDNLKEKRNRNRRYPYTGCSNNPTNENSTLIYNQNGNQSAQHNKHRSVKNGGSPDEDEHICANVLHDNEHFCNNANDVTMRAENMCTTYTNINGAHINDPRMKYADISISNYKTHSSKYTMDSIDKPASVVSLNKRIDIQLMTQSEENFGDSTQDKCPMMACEHMAGVNTNHKDSQVKNVASANKAKDNAANMISRNVLTHQRAHGQHGDYKNLIMTGDVASFAENIPPMEEKRMEKQLPGDSIKQKAFLFYQNDDKLDDFFTHSNKGDMFPNAKRMQSSTMLNMDLRSGHNPHNEHKMKEVPTEHNPFKRTEYIDHSKTTENYHNRSSNMYEKEAGSFSKNSVSNQWNRKPGTSSTVHRRKKDDEGVNVSLNTNASVNINYNHEDSHTYQSKNAYMRDEQTFPGESIQGQNYNNALCKNHSNIDERNDEILHETGMSHLLSSRGQVVDNIYRGDNMYNGQVLGRGAPAQVAKSVQIMYHVYVNNATQEHPQRMGDPYGIIYYPSETHTNGNSYNAHPNFLHKEDEAAQRSIEKNPCSLHSHIKSASMDGGKKFYKMEEKDTMSVNFPTDRGNQNKQYDPCRIKLFDNTQHNNVNGEQPDWFACKTDFEQNASERKGSNNMAGGIGTNECYLSGNHNDERSQRYMHMGGVASCPSMYPSSCGRYTNGVTAKNGDGLLSRHEKDTTIHSIRKNNNGDMNGHMNGDVNDDNNCRSVDKGININVSSALNEAEKKRVHMDSQDVYSELEESVAILNEVLGKNNENWNKPYSATNKLPTLRFTNNLSFDFANILNNYKDKSDNYLNKQYIQDLERIHFLIQEFINSYRCSDNLKSIFQLLQYEIEKEKRENLYFCQNQKCVVLTMPLNDIKKNYDNFGEPNPKEPICEYKMDTCLLENSENDSKGESCTWGRNYLDEDLTKEYNLVKNCSGGYDPDYDDHDYVSNDKSADNCVEKCTTGNCRGLCMKAPSCISGPNSITDVATDTTSVVVHTYSHDGSGKQVRAKRGIGNLPKTEKLGKHCISKKTYSGSLNESILSKMNIFIIRHNNRVYKFKLNSNFPLKGNQMNNKKNGKLFKLLSSFYKSFLNEKCNKRNVLLNEDVPLSYVQNVDPSTDSPSHDQNDNGVATSSHINNDENFYNIIQSSELTNIEDLFISDDEVNLIYMYNNNRNEKVYSLEKLDVLQNQNSTLSTVDDCDNTA